MTIVNADRCDEVTLLSKLKWFELSMLRVIYLFAIQRSFQAHQPTRTSMLKSVLNPHSLKTPMFNSTPRKEIHLSSLQLKPETNETVQSVLGKVSPRMRLYFTCKKCNTRNDKSFTKHAYTKGIVVVRCDGCNNLHLIADNLDWFKNPKGKNIEEILASKGEQVNRTADSVLEFDSFSKCS